MLTDVFSALSNHLSRLDLPFYLADCVPQGAFLPYLTADIQPPAHSGTEGFLLLTCWCTGETSNTQRLLLADQLQSLIPSRGLRLSTDSGAIVIHSEDGMQCVTQHGAQGVIFRFKLRFFPEHKGGVS